MESYKSDAGNLSFDGSATAANFPSEHVPLDHANVVTGTEILADPESFLSDSNEVTVEINIVIDGEDNINLNFDDEVAVGIDVVIDGAEDMEPNVVLSGEVNVELFDVLSGENNVGSDVVFNGEDNSEPNVLDVEINVEVPVVLNGEGNIEPGVVLNGEVSVHPDVLNGEDNIAPDVVHDDDINVESSFVMNGEANFETDVVLNGEVNVAPNGVPDGEAVAEPDVVLNGVISVEPVNVELVINDILRYMHCSCGQKRTAAEAIAEYLANHSHQSQSCFCQVFCLSSNLSGASSSHRVPGQPCPHGIVPASAGSGETSVVVVNSFAHTIILANDDEHEYTDEEFNQLAAENEILVELLGYIKDTNTGLRIRAFHLSITLHKYETPELASSGSKENCCICLEDYGDGEEVGKVDCGHVYHVECIKGWLMDHNTCPICKKEVLVADIP